MEKVAMIALAVMTAASNIWAAYETRQANFHYAEGNRIAAGGEPMPNQPKPSYKPMILMAWLTVLTWGAVGFDYLDRHYGSTTAMPFSAVMVDPATWDAPLEQTWCKDGQTYTKVTLPVDGKEYLNCTFNEVTFFWHGKRPGRFTNCVHTNSRLESDNVLVNQTFMLMSILGPATKVQCGPNPESFLP